MKTKTKTYRTIEKKTERKKRRSLNNVEHSIWKKKERKKEQTFFSKIESTSLHRLKKKKKRKLNIFEL